MTTLHQQMTYRAGDTIQFDVICKDADGTVVNLSGIDIEYMLNDPYGENVETYTIVNGITAGTIEILDMVNGKIGINVDADRTRNYLPGYYSDQLRLTVPEPGHADIVVSELVGYIFIKAPLRPAVIALQAGGISVQSPTVP